MSSVCCEGYFQNLEQFHFGDFLVTVHISCLQKQPDLIFSSVPFLFLAHGIVEVGRYLGILHIAVVVLVVFLEYNVYRFADLLVTTQHQLILQMEQDTFVVAIGQQQLSVSRKVADVSIHFHNILTLGIDEQQIQIDPTIVDKQTFDHFLRFCAINDYHEPVVCKVTTNNIQEVLDSKNYDFIKEFPIDSEKLMKLLGAANFLVCRGLKLVIAAVYACKIYFEDTKEAYLNKKKELNIPEKDEITFEDDHKYRQDYMIEESIINDTV